MEMSEFLQGAPEPENPPEEIDVQRAVVESLAADKAEMTDQLSKLRSENYKLKSDLSVLQEKVAEMKLAFEKIGDHLLKNTEQQVASNQVSVLERCLELNDKFEGETRDHILEVLAEAKERDESTGRNRRAQLLEAILLANDPVGILKKKRSDLEKVFNDNANVINGTVIKYLQDNGISHKDGENYLLPSEIMKKNF